MLSVFKMATYRQNRILRNLFRVIVIVVLYALRKKMKKQLIKLALKAIQNGWIKMGWVMG